MRQRCENPKRKDFARYGGRGIKVCERWRNFQNFFADMGARPSPGHSIDRVNNDGNYEPSNCRWATIKEQNQNRRLQRRAGTEVGTTLTKYGTWQAQIAANSKHFYLGSYPTEDEAAAAYRAAEARLAAGLSARVSIRGADHA